MDNCSSQTGWVIESDEQPQIITTSTSGGGDDYNSSTALQTEHGGGGVTALSSQTDELDPFESKKYISKQVVHGRDDGLLPKEVNE